MLKVGVLSLQGDFAAHGAALERAGAEPVYVRERAQFGAIDGLVIPGGESTPARSTKPRWNGSLDEVKVPVTVEWQGLKMSAGDITRLMPGDLLGIDPACAAQVLVRFGKVPKFLGRPGTSDAKWAVQLTSSINS